MCGSQGVAKEIDDGDDGKGAKEMDYSALFPGKYLKAGDLINAGGEATVTMKAVRVEEVADNSGGKKRKGIITFSDAKKEFVCNRTNAEALAAMFGRDIEHWGGHAITLHVEDVNGEPGLRVKGSPELKKDLIFILKLPGKLPKKVTLVPTQARRVTSKSHTGQSDTSKSDTAKGTG